jgi:hypothetical protein
MTTKQKYSTLDDNVKVAMGRKNLLINGDFSVWQRDNEFLGLTNGSDTFSSDRWRWDERGSGTAVQDLTRSTDAPSGFLYSCKIECTSSGTTGVYYIQQKIEGVNAYVTGWDKVSDKKNMVLSFWLKCSKVGKLGGAITDSGENNGFPFDVTVSSANDWERHEVKITAPPAELDLGVNGTGLVVKFALANDDISYSDVSDVWVDSIYPLHTSNDASISIDQTGDTLNITGVQFELGSVATEFEYMNETDQLARCQRYFQLLEGNDLGYVIGYATSTIGWGNVISLPTEMREQPATPFLYTSSARIADRAGAGNPTNVSIILLSKGKGVVRFQYSGTNLPTDKETLYLGDVIAHIDAEL